MRSRERKKVCATLNYIDLFLILTSTITGCISIYAFASWLGIPVGSKSSAIGLKIFEVTAVIKKYKPMIKENENNA